MGFWSRDKPPKPPKGAFGFSPNNAIPCDGAAGESSYIASLRCPSGHAFRLTGPRGSMPSKCTNPAEHQDRAWAILDMQGGYIVDHYTLACAGGEYSCGLYFDMYHPDTVDDRVPDGLTRSGP